MAKTTFGAGKFRGKVGGFVYRNDAGVGNVVSEYNPHPSNPRTLAQTQQRSKMNLAGLYSKLVKKDLIAGLDTNNRKARSKFVSNLLKSISNQTEGNNVISNLDATKVKFSDGISVPISGTCAYVAAAQGVPAHIAVNLTLLSDAYNVAGGMVIIVGARSSANVDFVTSKTTNTLTANVATEVVVNVPDSMASGEELANVYFVPIMATDGAASVDYWNYLLASNPIMVQAQAIRNVDSGLDYASSIYIGHVGEE